MIHLNLYTFIISFSTYYGTGNKLFVLDNMPKQTSLIYMY